MGRKILLPKLLLLLLLCNCSIQEVTQSVQSAVSKDIPDTENPKTSGPKGEVTTVTSSTEETSITDSKGLTANDLPQGKDYVLSGTNTSGAMSEGWSKMSRNFIHTVCDEPPIDDILEVINSKEQFKITDTITKFVKAESGFIACLAFGFLFIVAMLVGSCCFMCCRCCCNNCGAKRIQRNKLNINCRRQTYSALLFISLVFIIVGSVNSLLAAIDLKKPISELDKTANNIMDDVIIFMSNTQAQIRFLGIDGVSSTVKNISEALSEIGPTVGDDIIGMATKELSELKTNSKPIQDEIDDVLKYITGLMDVTEKLEKLNGASKNLREEITNFKGKCMGSALDDAVKTKCSQLDTSVLNIERNLPNDKISKELDKIKDISLIGEIEKAEKELEKIPQTVGEKSQEFRANLETQFAEFQDKVGNSPFFTQIESEIKVLESNLSVIQRDTTKIGDEIRKNDSNRLWAMVGLVILILVPTCLMLLGLCCGILGKSAYHYKQPMERNSISHCGGITLLTGTYILFFFSWILMLLTMILFQIGGHTEVYACGVLREPDSKTLDKVMGEILTKTDLSQTTLKTSLFNISLVVPSKLLKGCRDGQTLFQLLDLRQTLDLDKYLTLEGVVDIEKELEKINLGDLAGTDDLIKEIEKNKEALDFKELIQDLNELVESATFEGDPDGLSTKLDEIRDLSSDIPTKETLKTLKYDLGTLINSSKEFQTDQIEAKVKPIAKKLSSNLEAKTKLEGLPKTVKKIQENVENYTKETVETFAKGLLKKGETYIDFVNSMLSNHVAKCKVLTNIADVTVQVLCGDILDPMNGYWFGLGCCLFFEIFAIAFATKLSKHYLRMDETPGNKIQKSKYEDDDEFYGSDIISSGSGKQQMQISISYPNNGQVNNGYNNDRLDKFNQY